jgi:hypothetical protein
VYNLKNDLVMCNLPTNKHIYLMMDGTFKFEDETNSLSPMSYKTFEEVSDAFVKYSTNLIHDRNISPTETGRRFFLADAIRGLRAAVIALIYNPENADFQSGNLKAQDAAGRDLRTGFRTMPPSWTPTTPPSEKGVGR